MATIERVRCDYCRGSFPSIERAEAHERVCASRPTGAAPDEICARCNKREDAEERGFVHGDRETSVWYVHRPSGWRFPQPFQHRFVRRTRDKEAADAAE